MAEDPRWKWTVFSGLTRREQQVLVFLILIIGAGLAYEQYKGGWRREPLVFHQAGPNEDAAGAPAVAQPSASGAERSDSAAKAIEDGLLDLNRASAEQLEALPGIGPVRAEAIVRYRQTHGPFRRVEDITRVSGIGPKTLEAVRPYLQPLDGPSSPPATERRNGQARIGAPEPTRPAPPDHLPMVNINTATVEDLCTLHGVGPVLAQRIVEYRRQHGPFRAPAEIQRVRGIGRTVFLDNQARLTVGRAGR
ncbi:MAG: hypothetical protein AMJ84_05740 [Acidithiobacillales bacterium SM23_46]|nr:MAG: hypothetical protein AMJ84_05740 [Acidithiobacillales bacterium SM23_46]